MITGRSYTAEVVIGELNLGVINVTVGLDRTMTLKFAKGENTIGELDTLFRSEPDISIDGEVTYARKLQAYRVDASNNVEVSFLTDVEVVDEEVETVAENETVETEESNEVE